MTGADRQPDRISVVVVNYNAGELLDRCLDSVRQHGSPHVLETIVVDNASVDGSADRAAGRDDIVLVRSATNDGFTVANNAAIRRSRGEFVLMLNPDAELTPGALGVLMRTMREHPRTGAVGPRLVYPDGRFQRWTAGREPGVLPMLAFVTGADRVADRVTAPSGLFLAHDVARPLRPDWLCDAALLLRRTALDQVGLLDEGFFAFMEDVDLCRRLRESGWAVRYEPSATCIHVTGGSAPTKAAAKRPDYAVINLVRYHARTSSRPRHAAFLAVAGLGFLSRYAAHTVLSVTSADKAAHRTARTSHLRHLRALMSGGPVPRPATTDITDTVTTTTTPTTPTTNDHDGHADSPPGQAHAHAHGHGHGHGRDDGGLSPAERHQHEIDTYNALAIERWGDVPDSELVQDPATPPFPNRAHVDFLTYAVEHLQPLQGARALEVGCGSGSLATYLALLGADVTAIDLSDGMVAVTNRRAAANGVADRCHAITAAVEELDLPDEYFDIIIGNQVLHHVELELGMKNMARMLAPGGRVAFCEPVLLLPETARRVRNSRAVTRLFPLRTDSPDERSLGQRELDIITGAFDVSHLETFQIMTRLENFVPVNDRWYRRLEAADRFLLRRLPSSATLGRYVVVTAGRSTDKDNR